MSKDYQRGQDTFPPTAVPLRSSVPVPNDENTFILEPTIPSATIRSDPDLEAHEKSTSECTGRSTSVDGVGYEPLATNGPVSKNRSTSLQRSDAQKAVLVDGVLGRGVGVEKSVLRANTLTSLRRGEPLDLSRPRSGIDWIVPAAPTQSEKKVESENHP